MGSVILMLGILPGCGDPVPAPEAVARNVVSALAAQPPLSDLEPVFKRLATSTRAELEARAVSVREATGVDMLSPWELFGPRVLSRGDRVLGAETVEEGPDTAEVRVDLVSYVPGGLAGSDATRSVIVHLVREEGQWKVILPLTPTP